MQQCSRCANTVATGKRHDGLERLEVVKEFSYHGNHDHDYRWRCKTCGSEFVGDHYRVSQEE